MSKCKDCKHWDSFGVAGKCEKAEWINAGVNNHGFYLNQSISLDSLNFWADAHDDSGLEAGVITGPEFGCIKFEKRSNDYG